jgi:transposase
MKVARNNAQVRQLMTAPGIGPVTALCFVATIDDRRRFKRSKSVGTYVGLTTRRYASGEIDWTGRISKCGDKMLRSYLFEAADVLFTRVAKNSTQSLGHSACEAKRAAQSQGCGCAKARCHSASDVDRRYRI